ncbi:MAG: stress protein [Cyclobacteriaceae bacterium]
MNYKLLTIALSLLANHILLSQPMFDIEKVDQVETFKNTVTCTTHEQDSRYFLYSGGDSDVLDAFEINLDGSLIPIESYKTTRTGNATGLRGLVSDVVHGKNFLFVGLKGEAAIEVYEIKNSGKLKKVFLLNDTDSTYLQRVITLQVIHMTNASYLYAGGLETKPGMSAFKILPDGSLEHIMSMADNENIYTDGIIGMSLHRIEDKTYLFTGGFQDNGLSSWVVNENGTFENLSNIGDDYNLFLNGTYPVISSTVKGWNHVIVGHRHHSYYKPTSWVKDRFSYYYHGDAISVFWVNGKGELTPRSAFIDNTQTLLQGQTRLHGFEYNENYDLITAATRDDQSIQLCTINQTGRLTHAGNLKINIPVYYGLTGKKIGEDIFLFAGSVEGKELISYRLKSK